MSCFIFIKNVNFKLKMEDLLELALGFLIAAVPCVIVFNFFYAIFYRFVPFEIPLISKRCNSCGSRDIIFLGSQDSISFRNKTASGVSDKRFKNNTRYKTIHTLKCSSCNQKFNSPTASTKVGVMFFLLNKFLFPFLPESPFTS